MNIENTIDELFDDLFKAETEGLNSHISIKLPNDENKTSLINKLHTPTSTEQIYRSNVSNLLNGHLKTDYDCNQLICDYEYILNIEAPKLERGKNRFRTDDFSLFFAALCAVYYQFYISALCNKTNHNEMLNNLKNKIISCLKAISTEYSKLYEDKEINSLFSQYNSCSKKWHMEKRDIMKEFIKSFKCSENEFPFILFIFTTKYFKYANSPIVKNELYIISLYCAYHSNKRFIYKNANNFILNRFFRYKECCERSSKNLILTFFQNYSFTHPKFQSIFDSISEILKFLYLDYSITSRQLDYSKNLPGKNNKHPRKNFIKIEYSLLELLKWCLGKSVFDHSQEVLPKEQITEHLLNALSTPTFILKKYPATTFLIYWSISNIKYYDFKSIFLEKTNKPESYQNGEEKEYPHIKNSEYKKFTKNDFISIENNKATALQLILFFALFDTIEVPLEKRFSENELASKFINALSEDKWANPQDQLELLNAILKAKDIPTVTHSVDFTQFSDNGFTQTESALNLIYNINSFNLINPELGIIQQVNHLDELRDRIFSYHNEKMNEKNLDKINEQKLKKYEKQVDTIKSIDCGFNIGSINQSNLTYMRDQCKRDMICKLFSETDTSCVTAKKENKSFRHQYRLMLSTVYIKPERNMFVHYAPFNPTLKLLELRNFNDLLGILYDVKSRLECDSTLYSIAKKYKTFKFDHKGGFLINDSNKSCSIFLTEVIDFIIDCKESYLQKTSSKKISDSENFIQFPFETNWKIEDPIFKSIYKEKEIKKEIEKIELTDIIPQCFDILKTQKSDFINWINDKFDKKNTTTSLRKAILSLESLKNSLFYVFNEAYPYDENREKRNILNNFNDNISAWISYFEWRIVQNDLEVAQESLKKIDYEHKNIANLINFNQLKEFSKNDDYSNFENAVQDIAKKLPSFILFKNISTTRDDFGHSEDTEISLPDNNDFRYKWIPYDINAITKNKKSKEMIEYLNYIEYEVLKNENYDPSTPQFKIDLLDYLKKLDSFIKSNFKEDILITKAKAISKDAQNKLNAIKRVVHTKSVNVFKGDATYNIDLLEITKNLLLKVIYETTSNNDILKKLDDNPILDHDGNLGIDEDNLEDLKKNKLGSKKYPKALREDLQRYLNYIFGVSGLYQYSLNYEREMTLFDLYGEQIFLYLLRVSFEMSLLPKQTSSAS